MNKHEFAIYFDFQEQIKVNQILTISDINLYHRIIRILRLELNDFLILFNNEFNVLAQITNISKKDIQFQFLKINKNITLQPKITIFLSLLKKDALQEAIYYCTEAGANEIVPIISDKTHFTNFSKDVARLKKIIISAAEQSKNFNFPKLNQPIKLEEVKKHIPSDAIKVFFDIKGSSVSDVLQSLSNKKSDIYLLIGPEGDLTEKEKEYLQDFDFIFCCLTPTVLRAQTAALLSLGIFRSLLNANH